MCNCRKKRKRVPQAIARLDALQNQFASNPDFVRVRMTRIGTTQLNSTLPNFLQLYGVSNYGLRKQGDTFYMHTDDVTVYSPNIVEVV